MQQQTVRAYRIKNEAETRAFALALADKLQAGDVLALIGELGTWVFYHTSPPAGKNPTKRETCPVAFFLSK